MGLTDLTPGYDPSQAAHTPSILEFLKAYVVQAGGLRGAVREPRGGLDAYHYAPATVIESSDQITELLAGLVQRANSGETPASSPAET